MAYTNSEEFGIWVPHPCVDDLRQIPGEMTLTDVGLADMRIPCSPVHSSSNEDRDDIIITAIPYYGWDISNWPSWEWEGCPSCDTDIIYELMEAVEMEHFDNLDKETEKLSETIRIENIFCPPEKLWSAQEHCLEVVDDEVSQILKDAEEDFDYEEWINSKQYLKSLEDFNKHKLLAWNKELDEEHPKWSGEYNELHQLGPLQAIRLGLNTDCELLNSYIKERYRVEVYVYALVSTNTYYAKGSTPYGDVYIPNKIANYLKDYCGLYEMDIALQEVGEKRANSFPWICVYLHNKGLSLE